jgi:hypothetical protein
MKFSLSFVAVVFFLSLIAFGISCNRNKNTGPENVVYYYPEKNIYYDRVKSYYYYSLDSARTWDSMAFKAPTFGAVLGPKIEIRKAGVNAWNNNSSHRKQYNGVILNIINNHTISLSKADRVNKLRAVVKAETQPHVEKDTIIEPAPERGLKKFFNKLFGKKKKNPEKEKER